MHLETLEEKELWKAVLLACLHTETCSYKIARDTADAAIYDYRSRIHVDNVDTQV